MSGCLFSSSRTQALQTTKILFLSDPCTHDAFFTGHVTSNYCLFSCTFGTCYMCMRTGVPLLRICEGFAAALLCRYATRVLAHTELNCHRIPPVGKPNSIHNVEKRVICSAIIAEAQLQAPPAASVAAKGDWLCQPLPSTAQIQNAHILHINVCSRPYT